MKIRMNHRSTKSERDKHVIILLIHNSTHLVSYLVLAFVPIVYRMEIIKKRNLTKLNFSVGLRLVMVVWLEGRKLRRDGRNGEQNINPQ